MARRKKHQKLPNGFGSIKYLGSGRYRPYGVYPPVTEYTARGPITPKAIAYTETWEEGYEILTARKMEIEGKIKIANTVFIDRSPTFASIYEDFFHEKYAIELKKEITTASMNSTRAAFKNCSVIHDIKMGQLRYRDLQNIVNACPLKHSSLELIISLLHQMYRYALKYDIVEKDYSAALFIPIPEDDESGQPFTENELKLLWQQKDDNIIEMLLIMCYSGYRIKAYENIEVNLKDGYFKGGIKTKVGKNRIVPIHSGIYDLVQHRYTVPNLLGRSSTDFRSLMYKKLEKLGILYSNEKKHTPHDCRHTFSMLCEKYGVNENDRKRMLGHSFKNDITNATYGHRSLEDLKLQIERIKLPN